MKVLVISDTHGSVTSWRKIENLAKEVDEIFHLGDVLYHGPRNPLPEGYSPGELAEELKKYNIKYIRGNCDADVDLKVLGLPEMPRQIIEFFGKYRFMMLHGEIVENDGVDLVEFARFHKVDVMLHGHTHIPSIMEKRGVIIANPGSLSLPKSKSSQSYMVLDVADFLKITIFTIEGNEVFSKVL
ncbi:phosphodiesterase [Thermosipho ferrireducens]|uniref:Phosphoesterase n=1 Tax=Thermosipho ferrireducens TaxID=2571116 RepID=A0ABX7S456_9BACT|nr:phosphodiesterase [Thermosipho ferrireducens]